MASFSVRPAARHLNQPVLISVAKLRLDAILPIVVYNAIQRSIFFKNLESIWRDFVNFASKGC